MVAGGGLGDVMNTNPVQVLPTIAPTMEGVGLVIENNPSEGNTKRENKVELEGTLKL